MYYGPLSLFLHAYSFSLEDDAHKFNEQFKEAAKDYA
jgi:hypothetical protein